jgi:hypothetical protein
MQEEEQHLPISKSLPTERSSSSLVRLLALIGY